MLARKIPFSTHLLSLPHALMPGREFLRPPVRVVLTFLVVFLSGLNLTENGNALPVNGTDSLGRAYTIGQRPGRVVSLVPEITEILIAIDAADAVVGVTRHTVAPEVAGKTVVGGFLSPDIAEIEALKPDLILAADLHREVREYFRGTCPVLTLNVFSIREAMDRLALLGRIFQREKKADGIIAKNQEQLDRVAREVAGIPAGKRLRVARLMGHDNLMVPGDDSFQNDYIRAAGAFPPRFGKNGQAVSVTIKEWQHFDPQAVYVCGTGGLPPILAAPGVKEVSAVRNSRIYSFSCDLTCRAGVNIGSFVTLLAGRIYGSELPALSGQVPAGTPSPCVMNED